MRRKTMKDAVCPIARSLDEIGDWWTLLIVREAFKGADRFGLFEKRLGLAKNILSARLKKMVADGILETRPAEDGAHHTYHLTAKGENLRLVLVALRQWGENHLFAEGEEMAVLVDKTHGHPIGRLQLSDREGRPLDNDDVQTVMGIAGSR